MDKEERLKKLKDMLDDHVRWLASQRVYNQSEGMRRKDLEPGFHGRWENLTLADCKFLFQIGIDIG